MGFGRCGWPFGPRPYRPQIHKIEDGLVVAPEWTSADDEYMRLHAKFAAWLDERDKDRRAPGPSETT
jgi:hypothetical protein